MRILSKGGGTFWGISLADCKASAAADAVPRSPSDTGGQQFPGSTITFSESLAESDCPASRDWRRLHDRHSMIRPKN
jgi:hypothetical protein